MDNATFRIAMPTNEPVLAYAKNSPEKAKLKDELAKMTSEVAQIPLYVGGERIKTSKQSNVVMPHNHQKIIASCSLAEKAHVEQAVLSCAEGRKIWAKLPWSDRAAVFLKAADLLATKFRYKINAATMLGQSKTCHQAEIDAACELIDFFRYNAFFMAKIYLDQPQSSSGVWNRTSYRALEGFVYAVTPFNFTSIALNLPTAPALMGCSVIWKPALTSVYSAWIGLEALIEAGLPKGVINFLPGPSAEISAVLLNHKAFSGLHFTGSTATFNHLWQEIAGNLKNYATYPRIVGETGGKDFIFAHPSANVDDLVCAMVRGAFEYQGQKCSAASRAFVPKSLWPEVKDKLSAIVQGIKMGDVQDFTNFMGAVIDRNSYDNITGYIKQAEKSRDAKIIAGGEYDDKLGYFIRPTVIETINPDYPSLCEEIFGPVLTVLPYEDSEFEKTLGICDSGTPYALTGAIFAKDRSVINHMTKKLENAAGNFYINDKPTGAVVGQQPFGGGRASGTNDKAGSAYNLMRWVSMRTIKETFVPASDYRYSFMDES